MPLPAAWSGEALGVFSVKCLREPVEEGGRLS